MTGRLHKKSWQLRNILAAIFLATSAICAQEMEPRAYSRAPVGTQIAVVNYTYQTGDVVTDASLPLRDVSVKLNSVIVGYGRTLGLAGRQANVSFAVPYIKGSVRGTVFEAQQSVTRSGLGEVRIRFMLNLKGSPDILAAVESEAIAESRVGERRHPHDSEVLSILSRKAGNTRGSDSSPDHWGALCVGTNVDAGFHQSSDLSHL